MSKMMIYAALSAIGGNIENVWGHKMRVDAIDPTDKDAVEQAKADGWHNTPQAVIEQIEAQKMQAENAVMTGKLQDLEAQERIAELEAENETLGKSVEGLMEENVELRKKLAVYENAKDTNGDGVVSYDEMTNAELQELLKQRGVEFASRDTKDVLIQKLKDSE